MQVDGRNEQSLTRSERGRYHEQPVLVYGICGGERMDDTRAPHHDHVRTVLTLRAVICLYAGVLTIVVRGLKE